MFLFRFRFLRFRFLRFEFPSSLFLFPKLFVFFPQVLCFRFLCPTSLSGGFIALATLRFVSQSCSSLLCSCFFRWLGEVLCCVFLFVFVVIFFVFIRFLPKANEVYLLVSLPFVCPVLCCHFLVSSRWLGEVPESLNRRLGERGEPALMLNKFELDGANVHTY